MSAFRWVTLGHREIADMLTSLICHGTLTRFPRLRIASVENGSAWIKPLFDEFEATYGKMPQAFPEHPHDVFRRNVWVSPFWEGSVEDVVQTVGWDRVLFGSDYPHPEGLADPVSHLDSLGYLNEEDKAKVMGGNLTKLIDA
jgi:predicted TIM-barrel fold metal-dependent hydrolase